MSTLEIDVSGEAINLFADLPDAELRWLAAELSRLLPDPGEPVPGLPHLLSPADQRVAAPLSTRWREIIDGPVLRFTKRGRLKWDYVFWIGLIAAFTSGPIVLFGLDLIGGKAKPPGQGDFWILLAIFPLLLVGPAFSVGFLFVLLEPVHRTTWLFAQEVIELEHAWLGMGPRWNYPTADLSRIELDEIRSHKITRIVASHRLGRPITGDSTYALVFVGRDNVERFSISDLSRSEALWIGERVLNERPNWFYPPAR
jgi:hypothetical protein